MISHKLKATAVARVNSLEFVEQVFDLYEARQPVVMVSPGTGTKSLEGLEIDRCVTPGERTGWFTARHPVIHEDSPAQVTFTSGTEGEPKGILLTHANLADAVERIVDVMQMTSEIREYVGVPATFSFGLARYRAVSAVGGAAYLPPRGFDPFELARMLDAGEVNALSAVPTLLRVLLDAPAVIGEAGRHLRWMEIGSQHMTPDEKRRIRKMFPNALIVQHYGLTEASRTTFLKISEVADDLLDSVGTTHGKTELRLAADGRIQIRGPHVARSRVSKDGLHPLVDDKGWFQTNDLGRLEREHLFFEGRADDLINCGGVKVSPDQLEQRIRRELPMGTSIAIAKVPDAQRGDGVLVAVQSGAVETGLVKDLAAKALLDMGVAAGSALHVMPVDAMPVTGTGKVQRKKLAEAFLADHQNDPRIRRAEDVEHSDVLSLFRHEFPGQAVSAKDTFEKLGGDSLHYIQFSLGFEQRFGQLPDGWERKTVAELQRHISSHQKSIWRRLETVTLTRAFFMVCIIALHANAFVYSSNWGAAYFLVLLAGYSVARFQLPEIIRSGSVKTLLGTIKYVAVPTLLMVILLQILTGRFEVLPLLLVSNYLDPASLKGYAFYFMEFYIQLLVLAAVVFSIPKVRASFATRPLVSAMVLFLCVVITDRTIEAIWNGDYNYHRTPWHYAWAFTLGIVLATAKDMRTKVLALIVATVSVFVAWGPTSAAFYVEGGCALVLFVQAFIVPAPVKILVGEIANASMFVYLSHFQMISVVDKIFGEHRPWVALVSSVLVGILMARGYKWLTRLVRRSRLWQFARSGAAH